MKYRDYITVDENFQYSVNLQFDLYNIDKIKNYIPTKDGCDVLKLYINSIIQGKNRATTLIGPYGKGKSHLLLVLLMLISDFEKNDQKAIDELISKISLVDEELANSINSLRNSKTKLMPIIINSNYNDLNQAFLLGINDALEREKIQNVVIDSSFDSARNILIDWENNHPEIKEDLNKCLQKYKATLEKLKSGLKNYDKDYYVIFQKAYECITHGQQFNPLINSDIIKNYKDVNHLLEEKGYSGLFIAFDEFSKFLDSTDSTHIMKDLKILQDFAELANRTGKNEQIHLSCITHKGMTEYLADEDEDKINAYKTVEGRFKNVFFNRSMEQNYEIVSYAIKKGAFFEKEYKNHLESNAKFYLDLKELSVFSNVDNIEEILFKGCFPLNPLTTYSLIELSEKIAQNERTLFTFLTDDDPNSLKSFIQSNNSTLFDMDNIYDYFESTFKNTTDTKIKDIWYKSSNLLKKNISDNAKRIIKSVSIIYMINELDDLAPNVDTIKLSLNMSVDSYNKALNELLDKSLLRKKKITEDLDFATIYSKQLTQEIKELTSNQFSDINEKEVLERIIGNFYTLPRRYNEEYKMTRFFNNIFISESEIMNLSNFDVLHTISKSDGIVLNLIRTSKSIDSVIEHFRKIKDDRVVLKISKLSFKKSFINLLKEYEAVNYMLGNDNNSEDISSELELIKEELVNAVKDAYKYYFSDENILEYVYLDKDNKNKNLSSLLSTVCEEVYNETPIINNELVNKHELSAPIKKAREIVIDSILNSDKELIKSKTSAEATIYKATVDKADTESINKTINIIKSFIQSTDNNKKSFEDLYKKLCSKPISMRLGTIPILIALAMNDYSDNIILYYMNREIELNATNLVKINDNPGSYFIVTEKGTVDRIEYISNLEKVFNIKLTGENIRINVFNLIDAMKKWIFSLPRIIRELNNEEKEYNITEKYIRIKSELLRPDINNNEFLFITVPDILSEANHDKIYKSIEEMKHSFDNYIVNYIENLIMITKKTINSKYQGSLSTLLKEWNKELEPKVKNSIYDIKTKKFLEYIDMLNTHDDHEVVEQLSKIFTSFYVEDWQANTIEEYKDSLNDTIAKLSNKVQKEDNTKKLVLTNGDEIIEKNISSSNEISALGQTLKNNIEEVMNEYGDSLSEEEKVNILLDIMKIYM